MPSPERVPVTHSEASTGPASFAQQSQWFLQRLAPESSAYHRVHLYRLAAGVDVAAMEKSLNYLVERHACLRTTFRFDDGILYQDVRPGQPFVLEETRLAEGEGEALARQQAHEELRRPFDLENGPLFRARLLRSNDGGGYFLFATDHIIFDAWSQQVFLNDLQRSYDNFAAGSSPLAQPDLPSLEVSYLDYARWQRETLQGETLDAYLQRWRARLDGAPASLDLPLDGSRTLTGYGPAGHLSLGLSAEVSQTLRVFCRQERATLFAGVLAALGVFLSRCSGQGSIVLGCPFAGRLRPEVEQIIGMFVNTLPLRVDVDGEASFRETLKRARNALLDAVSDQALPFERLVSELKVERDLGRAPIFQATLNMRNVPRAPESSALGLSEIKIPELTTEYDLSFNIEDDAQGLRLGLSYNAALFSQESAELLLEHLAILTEDAVRRPDVAVSELALMSGSERHRLLVEWNDTAEPLPDACPYRLFEDWASSQPESTALLLDDRGVTYAELNLAANRLARRLVELGAGSGRAVALFVEPSIEAITGMLAVMKAGGACMPIPDDFPTERVALMLQDAGVEVILTQSHLAGRLPAGPQTVICMDDEGKLATYSAANLPSGPSREDPAIIYYTSGSTGRPKGVLVPHRGVLRMALNTRYMHIRPDDVVSQISSLSFDNGTEEIWGALASGATLAIIPARKSLSPLDLGRALRRHGVTVSVLTTSLFNLIAQEDPSVFKDLRLVDFGGESADYDSVRRVLAHGKPAHMVNGYGPTETTTIATLYEIPDDLPRRPNIPIGRAISNTTVYILDRKFQPVPIGVPGEILIGGAGVALGYLNQPELTSERFVPDPFASEAGLMLYRTGDLARFLPDGNIEFLGRGDKQVKLRGYRIELDEIELTLREFPGVKEVVVMLKEGPQGRFLAAFWTAEEAASEPDLRAYLSARLPDFMVPSIFVRLESFPYTASAKIDRRSLSSYDVALRPVHYLLPQTETEIRLAALWQQILGVEQVGSGDDFFELGGHSLLAAKLFARIEKEFGRRLPLAAIFQNGTLRALAALIDEDKGQAARQIIVPMQPHTDALGSHAGGQSHAGALSNGVKLPLFLVPGVGASPIYMRDLALALAPDQPVYGLAAVWRDSDARLIRESAELYSRELQRALPEGPYLLAGHSGGGYVALEIARLLRQRGGEVAFLGLLDTLPPGSRERPPLRARLRSHANNLRGKSLREVGAYARQLLSLIVARMLGYLPGAESIARRMLASAPKKVARAVALGAYHLLPYDGPVTIFRVSERHWAPRSDLHEGWPRHLRGTLTFVDVPGSHSTMMKSPHVQDLATRLLEHLPQEARH